MGADNTDLKGQSLVHQEEVAVTAQVAKDVDSSLASYYETFATKDEEWRQSMTKQLLRKVDLRLIPLSVIMYLLNFLDRSNLAQARLGTLEKDLKMHGSDFNMATSILFVGYLLGQLPSNLLITRIRPSRYLGIVMMAWGAVSACNAAVHSFSSLLVVRVMLGLTESPFFPGLIFLMSSWYDRRELTFRISWFYSGNALANMFGGLIAAGVLSKMEGAMGIAGWRWLFIIEGVLTIFFAFLCIWVLPNFPATTMWLSEEERAFAQWRLTLDAHEQDDKEATTLWGGLKLALADYRLYLFVLLQHSSVVSQTFQYFFPSIVKTLGYGRIETLLLTVPVWFATFLTSLLMTYTAGKTGDRAIHIMCLLSIACLGNIIATATTKTGPRFFAMFLMPMGAVPAYQIILSFVSGSFLRPTVKRASAIAICNMMANCASIYAAYMYPSKDGPRYLIGGSANAGVCVIVATLAFILRVIHKRMNKKIEQAENEHFAAQGGEDTERPVKGFRYAY